MLIVARKCTNCASVYVQIWDACSDSIITFNHDSLENLAYVAENNVILAGILKQLDAAGDRVHVKYGATVKDYKLPGGQSFDTEQSKYACVQLESGEEIRAKLMVGETWCLLTLQLCGGLRLCDCGLDMPGAFVL